MIEFLTLFVGLFSGPHGVHLQASENVAAIEIRLDGELVETLEKPPWSFEMDFGAALLPHEVVAIARDHRGREVDRAQRRVNLSQATVAARLDLLRDASGWPHAVRLSWESLGWRGPRQATVLFDGQPLKIQDARRIPLPAYDRDALHFLSATLGFDARHITRLEASFGGILGAEVSTGLTAIAVTLAPGRRLGDASALAGALVRHGEPLMIHGVEKGPAEVAFVIDAAASRILERLERRRSERRLRSALSLGAKTQIRILDPRIARLTGRQIAPDLFLHTPPRAAEGGFLWLEQAEPPAQRPVNLADAVALAGLETYATRRRRAVVLLLADHAADGSIHQPALVREYLQALQVPFYVWSLGPSAPHATWGSVQQLETSGEDRDIFLQLQGAIAELRRDLESQRLVWVRGEHLPQEIEPGRATLPFRMVGR